MTPLQKSHPDIGVPSLGCTSFLTSQRSALYVTVMDYLPECLSYGTINALRAGDQVGIQLLPVEKN